MPVIIGVNRPKTCSSCFEFVFGRPETWDARLTRLAAWLDHEGPLSIIEAL
ncbi:hypothetical protein ABZ605_01305 [Streptomyces sp. NPDC012765]|uniref:hypothetical protein n=1 Tax=Streptomyces sp. NPDC012765 TaxID=3155249 RepID=UPI0033DBB7DF